MEQPRLVVSVPSKELAQGLDGAGVPVDVVLWDVRKRSSRATLDIVVAPYLNAAKFANLASVNVRLVQSQSIGFDGVRAQLPAGIVFANAASVHEASTAELTMALILASQRGIPDFVRAAKSGRWARAWYPSLADRTIVLVGYGGVARAVEDRLAGFETRIERVARSARSDERGPVHGLDALPELLALADIVVVAVPLDRSTFHLVNDDFLSAMRDGALLVNVSRGPVADTNALVRHARQGRLRLALDVVDPEPLPQGHPLYGFTNVLISPHVGGATSAMMPRMVRLLVAQIERMLAGDEPLNVVLRT